MKIIMYIHIQKNIFLLFGGYKCNSQCLKAPGKGWITENEAAKISEILLHLNKLNSQAETFTDCYARGGNNLWKFQIPSSNCWGVRAFQRCWRPLFPLLTLYVYFSKKKLLKGRYYATSRYENIISFKFLEPSLYSKQVHGSAGQGSV